MPMLPLPARVCAPAVCAFVCAHHTRQSPYYAVLVRILKPLGHAHPRTQEGAQEYLRMRRRSTPDKAGGFTGHRYPARTRPRGAAGRWARAGGR